MQLTFNIIVTILLFLLSIMWAKKSLLDVSVKTLLFGLSIYGLILVMSHFGYIIKQ
jgi:amino acid permease